MAQAAAQDQGANARPDGWSQAAHPERRVCGLAASADRGGAFHHAWLEGGIGQANTTTKSNKIKAIPLLLARLELTGAILTIDAIGTQTTIAETILHHGGDYLLALKANRPATHADVATFFEAPPAELIHSVHETIDADHGRLEQRRHLVCHDVDWLFSDRRYTDEPRSPKLAMIAMVETRTERSGRIEQERRCYLSSAKPDAKAFAAAVRSHWGIENRLHWYSTSSFTTTRRS